MATRKQSKRVETAPDKAERVAGFLSRAKRIAAGNALRELVPRESHGGFPPPRNRRDPVEILTPSLQTALVIALAKMGNIAGVESVIRTASQVQGETHVRFFVESIRMLGQHQGKEVRLTQLRMSGMVPLGIAEDGTLVIAAAPFDSSLP